MRSGLAHRDVRADRRMAGAVTMDYLAGVATDRSQMLNLVAGMASLATMLIQMRAEETGAAPEDCPIGRLHATRYRVTV